MKIPEILIVETIHQPGSLAKVLQVIANAGLTIEHLTALRRDQVGRQGVWDEGHGAGHRVHRLPDLSDERQGAADGRLLIGYPSRGTRAGSPIRMRPSAAPLMTTKWL